MEPADVVDAGFLHERPDAWGREVRELVLVCGGEVRAHAAVVAGDDHAAAACGVGRRDEVFCVEAGGGAGGEELRGGGVGADAADVEDGGGGEDVLCGGRGGSVREVKEVALGGWVEV